MSSTTYLKYADGTLDKHNGQHMRGVTKEGKRPVEIITDETDAIILYMYQLAVSPDTEYQNRVSSLYIPLDKYIEYSGTLVQLYLDTVTQDISVYKNETRYKYNESLDGSILDKHVAVEKYPEYFV